MLAALAAAATVSAAPAHLGPQHQRGDIYIPGTVGGSFGLRTVIDIVRAHSHTGQGQVRATRRAPRVPTGPASAVTGKYTINFLVSISLSLLCSLLVPKISSPTLNTVRA